MSDATTLSLATLVLALAACVPLLASRLPPWVKPTWRVVALVLLTVLAVCALGSPVHPVLQIHPGWERLWQQCVVVGWWVVAARCVAGIARLLLAVQSRSRETQILSDLIGAGLYAATALAIVDVVFAIPVGGLIATSGVVAVVIGLALQSTLADVFSGIAIDIERPYRAGDLIWIEGGVEGLVQEVNWRSTRVVTGNGDIAVVPNSVMAKSRLINHSLPIPVRKASVEVRLDPGILPEHGMAILRAATKGCLSLMVHPAPTIALTALRGDGAVYEIAYSVASSESLGAARTELLGQIQRHLIYAAVPLAGAPATSPVHPSGRTPVDLLARSDLFGALSSEDHQRLASAMTEVDFDEDAILFHQADTVDRLYVVASGTIGILRSEPGGADRVRRMSPGSCLGIVGLITGQPFAATATALTPVRAYRLDKAGIAVAIAANPKLRESLEALAQRNLAAILQDAAAEDESRAAHRETLVPRMRLFLRLLSGEGTIA